MRTTIAVGICIGFLALPNTDALAQAPPTEIRFDRFHDFAEQVRILHEMEEAYPKLLELKTYGESYQGRALYILAITNEDTGPLEEKPAVWLDAAYDGGETYTTEVALYFLNYLLTGYGTNAEITEILDTRGFYILPNANPDAGEQLYQKPTPGTQAGPYMGISRNAWLIPYDDDGDGLEDEDPPEDLDGDGRILQMRMRDPTGHYKTDPRDPRLMVVRKPWEKGEWRLFSTEGIDSDGDGRINEDWYGGYDTNRNAPAAWDPRYIPEEVAPYPAFAPESRSFVDALLERPNVFAMVNLHTSGIFPGGTAWAAPVARDPAEFPSYDIDVVYGILNDAYQTIMRRAPYSKATALNSFVGMGRWNTTAAGLMSDYGYIMLGIPSWVQENDARTPDYDGDGYRTDWDAIHWQDSLQSQIWVDWKPFQHPQLGEVEIGGWVTNNDAHGPAPIETVPTRAEWVIPWYMLLAKMAPLVRITEAHAEHLGGEIYRVTARVRNLGVLDTNVTEHAKEIPVNRPTPVTVSLSGDGVEVESGSNPADLGHLRGDQPGMIVNMYSPPWGGRTGRRGEERSVEWTVRAPGGGSVALTASSSKGGTHRVVVDLVSGRVIR